jgi:SAM-dependent methyltransferase
MTEKLRARPRDIRGETELQYGLGGASANADFRRLLYERAADGIDIWDEMAHEIVTINPSTMLDVATGNAVVIRKARERGYRGVATGLDISDVHYAGAKLELELNYPDVVTNFVEGDAHSLPFEDETFDLVSNAFSIYHLEDPLQSVVESYRVLKPGGTLIEGARGIGNQERLWRLGGFIAGLLGGDIAPSFYMHCDIAKTEEIIRAVFSGQPIRSFRQTSTLDLQMQDWERYRDALSTLQPVMVDSENRIPPIHDVHKIADNYVWNIFKSEIVGNKAMGIAPRNVFRDRVDQAYLVVQKPQ